MEKFRTINNKTIIDGIDVSKCGNYDADQYFECEISSCHCGEIPNCHFKQLARAKEEIEELKEQLNNNQQEDDRGYCETYDCKYYNNLEECQKQNCWYRYYCKEHVKNIKLKKEFQAKEQEIENLRNLQDDLVKEIYDLKNKNGSIQIIADDLQRRNHDLAQLFETKKQECEELKARVQCAAQKYKQALDEIEHILEICFDDDWKATREIENIISKAKE